MTVTSLDEKVQDFLAQKRIAVVGVSRHGGNHPAGNLIFQRLKKTGHEVFPVNPSMQSFEGERCYPNLQSIPGGVDGAVIITRPEVTEKVVRDCVDAGVRRVWMHKSMAAGSSVSEHAIAQCLANDISVIPGGCPMMYGPKVDFGHAAMRWMMKVTGGLS